MATANAASMVQVFNFFKAHDYPLAKFRVEWTALTDKDKDDLREGIGNGTHTY
jgi:hypothetical protein